MGRFYRTNISLSAEWVAKSGRLVIHANGGSGDRTTSVIRYGSTGDNISPLPTRTHYHLDGLYTAATGGTKVVNADGTKANDGNYSKNGAWYLTSDINVYAHWIANSVTVTFDGNGGSIAKNGIQTFTVGKGQSFADTGAARAGYTLLGWADSSTAGGAQYYTLSGVADDWIGNGGSRTIYAIWTPSVRIVSISCTQDKWNSVNVNVTVAGMNGAACTGYLQDRYPKTAIFTGGGDIGYATLSWGDVIFNQGARTFRVDSNNMSSSQTVNLGPGYTYNF